MTATKEEHLRLLSLSLQKITDEYVVQSKNVEAARAEIKEVEERYDYLINQLRERESTDLAPLRVTLQKKESYWFTLPPRELPSYSTGVAQKLKLNLLISNIYKVVILGLRYGQSNNRTNVSRESQRCQASSLSCHRFSEAGRYPLYPSGE